MALLRRLSFIMFFIGLAGCGGGDGSLTNGSVPDSGGSTESITLSLNISPAGETVSKDNPLTVSATVMQGTTKVANKLVTFVLDDSEVAFFDPENGAVSTNSEGIASITLHAGGKAGGGNITASVDSGDVSQEIAFNSAGDGNSGSAPKVATISLFTSSPQIASSGADDVTLTAIAKDISNNLRSYCPHKVAN